ncbi:MAG: hypothetical protein ABSG68_05885 [Thermoguttaceae bacterium]|jgi:hypothetical protein
MSSPESAVRPSIADARDAVCRFLQESLPDVRRVRVVRLTPIGGEEGAWEAEAMVWQPNVTLETLGLHTERPVLDQELYVLRLSPHLDIVSYGSKETE